jgi:D-alanyl-D-alanine carboxypeptidase-like protein
MSERGRVRAEQGLRLRDSPRDGMTLKVIPQDAEVELLGRETWLRVDYGGTVGFVLADYVEPVARLPAPAGASMRIVNVAHRALTGDVARVDQAIEPKILDLAERAAVLQVSIWVTSSLREPYRPVDGAIVEPAKLSNHHIGHALDMNVLFDSKLFGSSVLGNAQALPQNVRTFLENAIPAAGLTWGGTFAKPDVVHIDDRLNVNEPDEFQAKLHALWGGG